jgi:glycosyltransferase involved in cell wall biosynthesis
VGGTNPSLLEAMASRSLIVANDNVFNRTVLEEDAFYFSTAQDISRLLDAGMEKNSYARFIENNIQKITLQYSWEYIAGQLLNLFEHATASK